MIVMGEFETVTYEEVLRLYSLLSESDKSFLPHVEKPNGWILGVRDGERLVGFIGANYWETNHTSPTIAVLPEWRGRGIGESLAEEYLRLVRSEGMEYIIWRCHKDNKASESLARHIGGEYISEEDGWKRFKVTL